MRFFRQRRADLRACGVADFFSVDVLQNPDIRQGAKDYANWPTFPQIYVIGELIGGSDITVELYQKGELQTMVKDAVRKAAEAKAAPGS